MHEQQVTILFQDKNPMETFDFFHNYYNNKYPKNKIITARTADWTATDR